MKDLGDEFGAEILAEFSWVFALIGAEKSAPPFIGKGAKHCLQNDPSKITKFGLLALAWPATIGYWCKLAFGGLQLMVSCHW